MSEPQTAAGRDLSERLAAIPLFRDYDPAIVAIEAEARAAALDEAVAAVEKAPLYPGAEGGVTTTESTTARLQEYRSAVLEAQRKGEA